MPLLQTSGNVTADGYGGGVAAVPNYIEDVFSTYLYTGVSSGQMNITNGIDLAGKGGAIWIKSRGSGIYDNYLFSTATGGANAANSYLRTNTNAALDSTALSAAFTSTGYRLNANNGMSYDGAGYGTPYASWTFRKQPKFFDIVTYTGNSATNRAISHSLGSTPGCIIFKCTSSAGNWKVYHNTQSYMADLDSTAAFNQSFSSVGFVSTNSTTFTVTGASDINTNGQTYVAYIFANNAGGFGLTGTDNVISCGSFTTSSGVATVNLGYEPQYVLYRLSSTTDDWWISDNMRGMSMTQNNVLFADLSDAESSQYPYGVTPTSTGFTYNIGSGTYTGIYIAIRRGPMKVPTSGTSVFAPQATRTGGNSATSPNYTANFPVDLFMQGWKPGGLSNYQQAYDRLRGQVYSTTSSTAAETSNTVWFFDSMLGMYAPGSGASSSANAWLFRRAPSFFDVVCYTGTGSATTFSHNLGVAPELMIVKKRSAVEDWAVYPNSATEYLLLNATQGIGSASTAWNNTAPTSSVFSVGTSSLVNTSAATYVAYLFATCAGVSKVGSYTGNGSTQTINCGFTGGARFVLIKRTDSTGDWYVYDTARGMTVLTDPYLLLNSTAAESATLGSVTTVSTGFAVNASILAAINTNAASYIFLAIA